MPANSARSLPQAFTIPTGVTTTNFTPGSMKYTGAGTDVALEGKGFFEVQLPNGITGLTRDGEFQVNSLGQLVTKEGYSVLGVGPGGAPKPIEMDSNNSASLSVSATGQVNQGSENRGQLLLTDVDNPQLLTQISGGYFVAQNPDVRQATSTSTVRSGYLEASNTSTVGEMANLMTAMRGFEANQHVIQIQDDRMNKAITELGNPS
jgi:flagellar basal body rod protein FlgG